MKVIVARNLVKYHGGDQKILSGATLAVESGEKIGMVGRNGAGKTTLLNVLSGNLEADGGVVERVGGTKVGMTSQSLYLGTERSVEQEMLSAFEDLIRREEELESLEAEISKNPSQTLLERYGRLQAEFDRDGGYEYRAHAASALSSLGFAPEDWKRPVSSFSGGEQSRIALARLLLSKPAGSPATPATTRSTLPRKRPGKSSWHARPRPTLSAANNSNALSRKTARRRQRRNRPRASRSS